MPTDLQKLRDQVASSTTVMGSASVLIRAQAATKRAQAERIAELIANATELEQLKADLVILQGDINAEADALDAGDDDLSAAVAENTGS